MSLYPFQRTAFRNLCTKLQNSDSTLVCMPTGTGKTHVFSHAVAKAKGRTLVLAHREELVQQAASKIKLAGVIPEIEMGLYKATADDSPWPSARCVVASVQSLNAKYGGFSGMKRMHKFMDGFSLLVIDEAHHAASPSYQKVIDWMRKNNSGLKVIGFTATPDRMDELRLPFSSVAYNYELPNAIQDGYLVPIEQKTVYINSLDFNDVSLSRATGDFSAASLDLTMQYEQNLHGVCNAVLQMAGKKKTLLFAASVHHAERMAEIFNRHEPGNAYVVHGKTPPDHRREVLRRFEEGKFQFLSNCMIATEGYDCPGIELVVVAAPTRSRIRYSQQIGRGTRPLTGTLEGLETPEDRRRAIAASSKPCLTVLDFTGVNAQRHKLVCTADLLGTRYPEEVRRRTAKVLADAPGPVDVNEVLTDEDRMYQQELLENKRKGITAKSVDYSVEEIDPFDLLDIKPARVGSWTNKKPLSDKQVGLLEKNGVKVITLDIAQQRQVMNQIFRRIDNGLATFRQMLMLQKMGFTVPESKKVTMERASELISGYMGR